MKRKVFDSIIFYNELDLLELRMNILDDVVDYFIITESNYTVSGDKKPLYFQENKERYSKWEHKIIHHITETIPDSYSDYMEKKPYYTNYDEVLSSAGGMRAIQIPIRFQRAIYNRDNSIQAILKSNPDPDNDIIICSDADEIPNPLIFKNTDWFDPDKHYITKCRAFYYTLNNLYQEDWDGSRISTLSNIKNHSIDGFRQPHLNAKAYRIEDGGWHWSFFGKVEDMLDKLNAYEHQENNTKENREQLKKRVVNGEDPFGRSQFNQKIVPIDETFPEYILSNLEKYEDYINISPPTKFNKILVDSSESVTEFCNLGVLYPTDKSPYNRGKGLDGVPYDKHSYTALYDFIFSTLKYKKINIGEIGIDRNNSMIAWRKYFPHATLYGWDLTEDSIENALKDELENTHYDFMDVRDQQSIVDGLAKPGVKYDILIDDSTHTYGDYIRIVNVAHQFMNVGGILIVEDILKNIPEEDFLRDLPNVRKYFNSITFVETHHKLQGVNHNNDKLLFLIRNDVN